jgi:hypothetical protein
MMKKRAVITSMRADQQHHGSTIIELSVDDLNLGDFLVYDIVDISKNAVSIAPPLPSTIAPPIKKIIDDPFFMVDIFEAFLKIKKIEDGKAIKVDKSKPIRKLRPESGD